jgi:hypothetical protein
MTTTHDTIGHRTTTEPPHRAYVLTVSAALADHGLDVTAVHVGSVDAALWHADLELDAGSDTGAVLVRWHELAGWSLQTRDRRRDQPAVFFGVSLVPPPAALAEWVAALVRHPELVPVRAGDPFATQDLDSQLRAYHTTER